MPRSRRDEVPGGTRRDVIVKDVFKALRLIVIKRLNEVLNNSLYLEKGVRFRATTNVKQEVQKASRRLVSSL